MSVSVNTSVSGGGGSTDAADINITDAGAYFTGTDVEAALQELGARPVGGGGGGDDPTDWGSFTGTKPGTVTVNGVTWTIGYTGDNITSYTVALTGADDLVVNVSYDNGYAEYSGNINVGGAVEMLAAQARYLRDELLSSAGAAANGFRARVTDLAAFTNGAGTTTNVPCVLEWSYDQYVPTSPMKIETFQTITHAALSNSGTLRTLVMPGWVVGKRNRVRFGSILRSTVAGSTATLTSIAKLNTVTVGTEIGGSGGSPSAVLEGLFQPLNSTTSETSPATAAYGNGGHLVTSAAAIAHTINTSTTDLSFTFEMTIAGTTAPTVTLEHAFVSLEAA